MKPDLERALEADGHWQENARFGGWWRLVLEQDAPDAALRAKEEGKP